MTNPGPGIPPCMISGLNSSNLLIEDLLKKKKNKKNCKNNYFIKLKDILEDIIISY